MARKAQKEMRILGIETSCDETAAASVENGTKILSNIIASSQSLHIKSGGIIPEVAAREQIKYLLPVIKKALKVCSGDSNHDNIEAIAVTVGPGLIGSLLAGVETAKTLAYLWEKAIIPVNHLLAHFYANWLNSTPYAIRHTPSFPSVALITSGGHTDLLLIKGHRRLRWLGGTRDDAAGEAFDKTARLLGLGYPGGPAIAAEAAKFKVPFGPSSGRGQSEKLKVRLPRPMLGEDNFDFSFSGLKTAVFREVNKLKTMKQWSNEAISYLAYEVQESITDVLVVKTLRAAQKYQVKSIVLGGGVTANQRLREKFKVQSLALSEAEGSKFKVDLRIPPADLCTDNAAVVASCAFFNYDPKPWGKIEADPGLYF